jgi:hypothetical protein
MIIKNRVSNVEQNNFSNMSCQFFPFQLATQQDLMDQAELLQCLAFSNPFRP